MPWKVIKNDNVIIDVLDFLVFVQSYIDGSLVRTEEPYASGVLSSDQSVAYHLENLQDFTAAEYETVRIAEIGDQESIALKKALATGEVVHEGDVLPDISGDDPDPDDVTPDVPVGDSGEVMSRAELTAKVLALEEELAAAKILLGVDE